MKYLSLGDAELFDAMNLDYPGLEKVKAAVATQDWPASSAAWGKYWAARQLPRYYFDPKDYAAGIRRMPCVKQAVISDADKVWSNDFQQGTYKPKRQGRSFQWIDQEPDTGYIGFLYFFWLKNFGRAYVLTNDEKYPTMFREIVCSLWDAAPEFPKAICGHGYRGVNVLWNNGLGSSLRCILMLDGYRLMRQSKSFTPELHSKLLRLFLSHARYVFENCMGKYDPSNFQASESAWMVTAGVMFPEFKEAPAWRAIGVQRTKELILRSFDRDGAQIEQCPQYHLTGIRDLTRSLMILHANGMNDISGDKALWKKMELIYDYPIRITHPTGHLGLFNSGVYGTEAQAFFPVGMQLFDSQLQAWAASRYIKPEFVPVAKGVSEYIMFIDGAWTRAWNKARQAHPNPPAFTNDLMKDSGVAILRSGWDKNAFSLLFDFNRQPWGGHAYHGRLSFDLLAYGVPMVVNPGSPISYSMPVYPWCMTTISHNTVMINEGPSPRAAEFVEWRQGRNAVFVSARIKEYAGFTHQRSIVSVPGEYFFFFDRLTGAKDKVPLAWLLHSPLDLAARTDGAIASPGAKPGLLIMGDDSTRAESEVVFGQGYAAVPVSYHKNYQPLDAWRSDVPYVRMNSKTDAKLGGQTYGVLLVPFQKEPPKVELATQNNPAATRLEVHAVSIRWPDHSDFIKVDYRKAQPVFRIVRQDTQGRTLWSEE